MNTPLAYAMIATDLMAIVVSLMLLCGNQLETHQKTEYGRIFSWIVLTNIVALIADCTCWWLDEIPENTVLLYISNTLSIVLALVLIAQFALYISAYISERTEVSRRLLRVVLIFCSAAIAVTLIGCICGFVFTIEDGVYVTQPCYFVYSAFALLAMVGSFIVVVYYRKKLGLHDSIAAYIYLALPTISAFINLLINEASFTYQAVTISTLVLYVMIQSEQNSKLMHEKQISTYYAEHDDLTGLFSRRAYIEKLEQLASADGTAGVIFSDINGLKYMNDNFGHIEGDRLIVDFADILKNHFRNEDIYRISGDEFIIIAGLDKEDSFYGRVKALEDAINKGTSAIACVGAAYGAASDAEALVQKAETAMYHRKAAYHEEHPEMHRLG